MTQPPPFYIRDLPKYEEIRARSARYANADAAAIESCLMLLRVASDVLTEFNIHLSQHRLSTGRFAVLTILNRNPDEGMTPSALAERAGVTRATMTGLLDGLQRAKWIRRQSARQDRRMAIVALTPQGRQFLDEIMPEYFLRISVLMGKLAEEEKHQLVDLLLRISSQIPTINGT